jgi:hypothetical protein
MYKFTKRIEQLKPSKKPRLPAAPLSGDEENKKKNKLKGHVVRTEEKKERKKEKVRP